MCADHLFLLDSATLHIWFQILELTSSAVASLRCSKQTSLVAYLVNVFSDSWTLLHPPRPHHVGNFLVIKILAPLPLLESSLFSGLLPKSCVLSSWSFLKPIWASATLSLLSHSSHLELTGTPSSGVHFVTLPLLSSSTDSDFIKASLWPQFSPIGQNWHTQFSMMTNSATAQMIQKPFYI